jgi:hypothetical protein
LVVDFERKKIVLQSQLPITSQLHQFFSLKRKILTICKLLKVMKSIASITAIIRRKATDGLEIRKNLMRIGLRSSPIRVLRDSKLLR